MTRIPRALADATVVETVVAIVEDVGVASIGAEIGSKI